MSVMIAVFLMMSLFLCGDTVVPFDARQWRHYDAVSEVVPGALRVRVKNEGKRYWGMLGRYLQPSADEKFLQLRIGNLEAASIAPRCANTSTGGGPIGRLYSGWNTFRLPPHAENRKFFLALSLMGKKDQKLGPWMDFQKLQFVSAPSDCPLVTLVSGKTAGVGSRLKIVLRTGDEPAENPVVRFCLTPNFLEYRFNGQEKIVLQRRKAGVYEAEIAVDDQAISFQSAGAKSTVTAVTEINGVSCYYALPFPIDVKTKNPLDTALINAATLQVRDDRRLWFQRTRGIDLARGRSLVLAPQPDYRLTKDDKDKTDLTRGLLTSHADDKIWFDRNAVGWYIGSTQIYLKLDLGRIQPVEKLVIRLLGGTTGNFRFPAELNLYVSKDDRSYHNCFSMKKLSPCEQGQCDWKRYYYLPEDRRVPNTRMYPFELAVQADARYLILNVTGETGAVFSDALACIKAEKKGPDYNRAYAAPGRQIPMEGLIIRPRIEELAVMKGLPAPQRFAITDMRPLEDRRKTAELVLELPSGLEIIGEKGTALPGGATRYVCNLNQLKGVYLFDGQTLPSPTYYIRNTGAVSGQAVIYGRSGGKDQFKTSLPIRLMEPPVISEPFRRLHVSLSWMIEKYARQWPDFYVNWRKLGFNAVSTFPRYWSGEASVRSGRQLVDEARKHGFKIIMNDSCFHMMTKGKKAGHEIYCQIPGEKHTMLCPSYRGEFYQKEMERVRRCTRLARPDYVFYDIEIWHQAHRSAAVCTRCKEAIAKSGRTLNDFVYGCGRETVADLKKAVLQGAADAGMAAPLIGSYGRQPIHPKYGIELWEDTYPDSLDMAQPSLYVAGRAADVHQNVRANHRMLKNKKLIPWLTAGCYGEFDSYKMEQMVLEALMNGAGGITYYCFEDFTDSPLDFYYHLKAMALVRPYEDLVMDGKVTEVTGSNRNLTYSMLRRGGEALLLVGNYAGASPNTTVELASHPRAIRELRTRKNIPTGQKFSFQVPKGDICLFHIRW